MAKRTAATAADTSVTVEAYRLDGTKVASVNPTADGSLPETQRIYSYSIPALKTGEDYVIKVSRHNQVLKKLVEKEFVVPGTVVGQTVDAVSTAAVVVASQKLSTASTPVVLGDPLPAGVSVTQLAEDLTSIKPAIIESSIAAAVNGGREGLDATSVSYANLYNLVVVAVSDSGVGSVDAVLAGGVAVEVPLFSAEAPTAPAVFSNISSSSASNIATESGEAYEAPATNVDSAAIYVQQAKQYLAQQDIARANNSFELALTADPNNVEANVGGAITAGLMIADDEDFKAIAARWEVVYPSVTQVMQGVSPVRLPFDNMTSMNFTGGKFVTAKTVAKTTARNLPTATRVMAALKEMAALMPQQKTGFKSVAKELGLVPANAPTVSEMQSIIDNVIIPRFDIIIARLQKAEAATGSSTFTVTAAMQGNPLYGQDVVLDKGEYHTLDAALNVLQVLLKISTAYNFDVPSPYTYDTIAQDPLAMINSQNVFVLKSDGKAKMTAALAYARKASEQSIKAFDIIKVRALGAGAVDVAGWTDAEKVDFSDLLNNVTEALTGPVTLNLDSGSVSLDVTKFFTNPLDRSDLPTFAYDLTRDAALSVEYNNPVAGIYTNSYMNYTEAVICDVYPTSDLPDYTLNGIFPGNSAANNIANFNGILPMAGGKVLSPGLNDYPWAIANVGTSLYVIDYDGQPVIKKIDPATGSVSLYARGSEWLSRLIGYQGQLYALSYVYDSTSQLNSFNIVPVEVSNGEYTLGSPIASIPVQEGWIDAIVADGADLYYLLETWDNLTFQSSYDVHKLSGGVDTALGLNPGYTEVLTVSNGYLYAGNDKYNLSTKELVASYVDHGFNAFQGGYFYKVKDDRLVKFYGTPAKGLAKSLLGFF